MAKKVSKGKGAGEFGKVPLYPSSKKPKKGLRERAMAKGVKEAEPMKQEAVARKEARKSGVKTKTGIEVQKGKG